jgi:hypothetical protein
VPGWLWKPPENAARISGDSLLLSREVFSRMFYFASASREPASRYFGDDTTSFGSLAKWNLTHAESRHHHRQHAAGPKGGGRRALGL